MIQSLTVISEDVIIGKIFPFLEEHTALVARSVCRSFDKAYFKQNFKYANIKRILYFINQGYIFDTLKYISLKPLPGTMVLTPLAKLPQLEYLDLRIDQNVGRKQFFNLPHTLRTLSVTNLLDFKSISTCNRLKSLKVHKGNSIPKLPDALKTLQSVIFYKNEVTNLSGLQTFHRFSRLTTLSLERSFQIDLATFPNNLANIVNLNISGCNIQNLSSLKYLTQLKTLNLASNPGIILDSLPTQLTSLTELDLAKCALRVLETLQRFPSIENLTIKKWTSPYAGPDRFANEVSISDIPTSLSGLKKLVFQGSNEEDFGHLTNFPQLQELILDFNRKINLRTLPKNLLLLKKINLKYCNLQCSFYLRFYQKLEYVDLSDNLTLWSVTTPHTLPCLKVLKLRNCIYFDNLECLAKYGKRLRELDVRKRKSRCPKISMAMTVPSSLAGAIIRQRYIP